MLALRCFGRKKKQTHEENVPAEEKKRLSGPQRSSVAVPETPAANATPASATPADAGKAKRTERTTWMSRLFGHVDATPDPKTVAPKQTAKRTCWLSGLCNCGKRSRRVAPSSDIIEEEENPSPPEEKAVADDRDSQRYGLFNIVHDNCLPSPGVKEEEKTPNHPQEETPKKKVVKFADDSDSKQDGLNDLVNFVNDERLQGSNVLSEMMQQAILKMILGDLLSCVQTSHLGNIVGVRRKNIDRFGFPNPGQSCYMNSSLQSLLTLEDLMRDISSMEQVWTSVPEAQLMRTLMQIRDVHASTDCRTKLHLLTSFKEAVSVQDPEFRDDLQKDAHEFLTSVLAQIRNLAPLLQGAAAHKGTSYTCPVAKHLVFMMENTRTCKSCGAQSKRQEEFTNLSLDLIPGGCVEQLLEGYQKETELDFRCECGGTTSGQRSSFMTLPKALILHLKRFRFTSSFKLEKVDEPIRLLRDMVVSSQQGGGCYSLVSVVSHFGFSEAGHYICDAVHPDESPDEPTDRWLTFNDGTVSETNGSSVCERLEKSAYILLYKRQV